MSNHFISESINVAVTEEEGAYHATLSVEREEVGSAHCPNPYTAILEAIEELKQHYMEKAEEFEEEEESRGYEAGDEE